jgi:hypothetical protein
MEHEFNVMQLNAHGMDAIAMCVIGKEVVNSFNCLLHILRKVDSPAILREQKLKNASNYLHLAVLANNFYAVELFCFLDVKVLQKNVKRQTSLALGSTNMKLVQIMNKNIARNSKLADFYAKYVGKEIHVESFGDFDQFQFSKPVRKYIKPQFDAHVTVQKLLISAYEELWAPREVVKAKASKKKASKDGGAKVNQQEAEIVALFYRQCETAKILDITVENYLGKVSGLSVAQLEVVKALHLKHIQQIDEEITQLKVVRLVDEAMLSRSPK